MLENEESTAGPTGKKGLSLDVWIEQIPFKETRNYVKNVLAFRQVYAQLIGQPSAFCESFKHAPTII